MRFVDIPTSDTLAGEPLDETLMATINDDLDWLNANQSSGGSGGGISTIESGKVAKISSGGSDNCAIFNKKRFHVQEGQLSNNQDEGFDPSGSIKESRYMFMEKNDNLWGAITDIAGYYLGSSYRFSQNGEISFKVKRGENFFTIGWTGLNNSASLVTVTVDKVTPSSLGLVDENGNVAQDTFSTLVPTTAGDCQNTVFYFGLDGNEHIVTVKNNSNDAAGLRLEFFEAGYRSVNPTTDNKIIIQSGIASSPSTPFNETELSFIESDKNGYTGAVIIDRNGVLSSQSNLNLQPAMTQVKPKIDIAFSSGPITTLPVKSTFYFPDNGILLYTTPWGEHFICSYTNKSETSINSNSFNGMIWQSQPTKNINSLNDMNPATTNATVIEQNINLWGTAPILVDGTNNKIDFSIIEAGVTTTHTATIPSGRYSGDLMPLGGAIIKAMSIAKPISGNYFAKYKYESRLWEIGIEDSFNTSISYNFFSGPSASTSIAGTIGFNSVDLSGKTTYIADLEKEHLSSKIFDRDEEFINGNNYRIKKSFVTQASSTQNLIDIEKRLGFTLVNNLTADVIKVIHLYPDDDVCGISVTWANLPTGATISYQIDNQPIMYLSWTGVTSTSYNAFARGNLNTAFLSFPRGSHKIRCYSQCNANWSTSGTEALSFVGFRQYYSKPNWEILKSNEFILKTYEIAPLSLYGTLYGYNGGALYSPQSSNDNINTITESGSWLAYVSTSGFNGAGRSINTALGYVDINFTLQGSGGGIELASSYLGDTDSEIKLFISSSAINESTDLVGCYCSFQNPASVETLISRDVGLIGLTGLKAGTYTARIKRTTAYFVLYWINIKDTVVPQNNNYTITEVSNTGQSVSYPINSLKSALIRDSAKNVPSYLARSGFKEGETSSLYYGLVTNTWDNWDDNAIMIYQNNYYYDCRGDSSAYIGAKRAISGFFKSVSVSESFFNTETTSITQFIDGVQCPSNYTNRVQVKGGSCPSASRGSASPAFFKLFKSNCTYASGNTFNVSDTRGIKVGSIVILFDGANKEKFKVISISTGVSFTVSTSPLVVVPANVVSVDFSGFHTLKLTQGQASSWSTDNLSFEPLTISPSNAINKILRTKQETISIAFQGVANGSSVYYPSHSDGIQASEKTSAIAVTATSAASAYNVPSSLKNISVGSGTINIKITSTKKLNEV